MQLEPIGQVGRGIEPIAVVVKLGIELLLHRIAALRIGEGCKYIKVQLAVYIVVECHPLANAMVVVVIYFLEDEAQLPVVAYSIGSTCAASCSILPKIFFQTEG
jgi:hypothetical protein